ncbi:hypothetical protein JOM56_012559 [Amanita muscaria]
MGWSSTPRLSWWWVGWEMEVEGTALAGPATTVSVPNIVLLQVSPFRPQAAGLSAICINFGTAILVTGCFDEIGYH